MKKTILLSILLPLAAVTLAGCVKYNGKGKSGSTSTVPTSTETGTETNTELPPEPVPPAPEGQINIYFVLGPNGSFEGETPTTVAAKFLDNTVVKTVDRGSALPDATKIKSSVTGSVFSHWVDRATTKVVTTAPDAAEAVLVAVFDGGDGGNTPTPSGLPTEGYGFLFKTPTDAKPYYKVATYVGTWPDGETNPDYQWKQYKIADFELKKDEQFRLYDFGEQAGWTINLDPYSFGDTAGTGTKWGEYLSKSADYYTVKKTFTAKDIYIKLKYQQDNLYMTSTDAI